MSNRECSRCGGWLKALRDEPYLCQCIKCSRNFVENPEYRPSTELMFPTPIADAKALVRSLSAEPADVLSNMHDYTTPYRLPPETNGAGVSSARANTRRMK